jgi:hypothetical protein
LRWLPFCLVGRGSHPEMIHRALISPESGRQGVLRIYPLKDEFCYLSSTMRARLERVRCWSGSA